MFFDNLRAIMFVSLVAFGCSAPSDVILAPTQTSVLALLQEEDFTDRSTSKNSHRTISDQLAQKIEKFSGAYRSGAEFIVLLAEPYSAEEASAAIAIAKSFSDSIGRDDPVPIVKPGKHRFLEFRAWEKRIGHLHSKHKATRWGFREDLQTIKVTVLDEVSKTQYLEDLRALELPPGVVSVIVGSGAIPATVRNHQRPAFLGIQIETKYGPSSGSVATCTAGWKFAAQWFLILTPYILTNSHCVQGGGVPMGGYTGKTVHQPIYTIFSAYQVGINQINPLSGPIPSEIGCESGKYCRYSDAAAIQLNSNLTWYGNRVSRTVNPGTDHGQPVEWGLPRPTITT